MKIKLLLFLMMLGFGVNAQTYTNFGTQWQVKTGDTSSMRLVGSTPGNWKYFRTHAFNKTFFAPISPSGSYVQLNPSSTQTGGIKISLDINAGVLKTTYQSDTTQQAFLSSGSAETTLKTNQRNGLVIRGTSNTLIARFNDTNVGADEAGISLNENVTASKKLILSTTPVTDTASNPQFLTRASNGEVKKIEGNFVATVNTIADLQAYSGTATSVNVKDPLRGGVFNYDNTGTYSTDGGVYFNATGKGGGIWARDITNADGYHVDWFGAVAYPRNNRDITDVDSRAAFQATADARTNRNTPIVLGYGVYMLSDSVRLGEGTQVIGKSTLWPRQYFGDGSVFIDYTNMSAVRFYNSTNGFCTTSETVPYRSQGIAFFKLGIFGNGRANNKIGVNLRQTPNSTSPAKTTGLVTMEGVYFADWGTGTSGLNSTDTWYLNRVHFSDVKVGLIGGSGQTFLSYTDFFKIDSIGAVLNSANDPDEMMGCEVETRYSASGAVVVNGRAQIIGNQFITNKKSIIFNSSSNNSIVDGNFFHSNSDDDITISSANEINIVNNTHQNDYINNTGYNYNFDLEPLNTNRVAVNATGARLQVNNNSYSSLTSSSIKPVLVNASTLTSPAGNKFYNYTTGQNEASFSLTGGTTVIDAYDIADRFSNGRLNFGTTTKLVQQNIQGNGITGGIGLIRDASTATQSTNLWFDNSANVFRVYSDANGLNFRTGGSVGVSSGTSFPFTIHPTTGAVTQAVVLNGSAGLGFTELPTQSTLPANPAAGRNRIYSNASGVFEWKNASGVLNNLAQLKLPLTGLLKGNGSSSDISVAVANTDFLPVNNAAMTGSPTSASAPTTANGLLRLTDLGTGWANYVDNVYTTGSPLTVNSGVTSTITNNASTVFNTQIPIGVTSFYDSATSKITPQLNGDSYLINVRFKARSNNANGLLDVLLDIGGTLNVIDAETVSLRKGTGVEQQVNVIFDIYSAATFLANGGLIKVSSIVGNTEIYDIQYKITRTHKAK